MRMQQTGFSMAELMVALVLGLFLTVAVLQTFIGAKQAYEYQQEFSRIQENGRFAMEFLTKDIRQADFWGCLKDGANVTSILNGGGGPGSFASGLFGFDNVQQASSGYNAFFGGTQPDAIVLQGGQGVGVPVDRVPSKISPVVHLQTTVGRIKKGDILLATDCTEGIIFQVSDDVNPSDKVLFHKVDTSPNPDPYPGNRQNGFGLVFGNDASVFKAGSIRYWIRVGTGGEPALVRGTSDDDWSTGGDELVEGIENLQILYGEDTTGNDTPNYFVPADQVEDMNQVVSVQIHLVARSLRDNILNADAEDLEKYKVNYLGGDKRTNDRRLRKVFVSTIALRNRLD